MKMLKYLSLKINKLEGNLKLKNFKIGENKKGPEIFIVSGPFEYLLKFFGHANRV
jgi:hypothetical protein